MEALAWFGALGGALIYFALIYRNGLVNWKSWAVQIVGMYTIVFAVVVVRRKAKRYRFNSQRRITRDARDPVLYLRSFYDDYEENTQRLDRMTAEELLASVLNEVGPVVAIGKPDDEVALLGAARIYFKDDEWKANISYLISIAQLVVIHANISEGLEWEIAAVRGELSSQPQKLLISFLLWNAQDKATRQDLYESFRKRAEKLLECSMPEKIGDASFMYFDSDWTAQLLTIGWWRTICFRGLSPGAVRETVRTILRRQDLNLNFRRSVASALVTLMIITLAALLFYSDFRLGLLLVVVLTLLAIPAARTVLLTPWWAR